MRHAFVSVIHKHLGQFIKFRLSTGGTWVSSEERQNEGWQRRKGFCELPVYGEYVGTSDIQVLHQNVQYLHSAF